MDKTKTPANQNQSLSDFLHHPDRAFIEATIESTVGILLHSDVDQDLVSNALFDWLLWQIRPKEGMPVTGADAVKYLAKLHRYRDALQQEIAHIERLYEDPA